MRECIFRCECEDREYYGFAVRDEGSPEQELIIKGCEECIHALNKLLKLELVVE